MLLCSNHFKCQNVRYTFYNGVPVSDFYYSLCRNVYLYLIYLNIFNRRALPMMASICCQFEKTNNITTLYISSMSKNQTLLLFLWLFPSSGVAAMVVDHLFPVSPVSCIALSQSYSLHVPLAHILPPCLWTFSNPSMPAPAR